MKSSHTEGVQRIVELDILRGIGIFSVILIHSTNLFYSNPIASFVWDANQFAVQLLVFCSSYIYFLKEQSNASLSLVAYFKKRILRLLKPYYIFVVFYFIILFIFQRSALKPEFIKQSILITGGIDINWLVLLMLQFAVAFPLISFLKNRVRPGFIALLLLSVLSSMWLLFFKIPVPFKVIMWLPWITIAFYSLLFVKYQKSTRFLVGIFSASLLLLIVLRMLEMHLGHSLQMYDNKYPPNLYFLMYGMMIVPFLLLLSRKGLFCWKPLQKSLVFLSKNSFSLYFIHSIILFLLLRFKIEKNFEWLGFFIVLITVSTAAQYLLNHLFSMLNKGPAI